jgi:hypothetical protein
VPNLREVEPEIKLSLISSWHGFQKVRLFEEEQWNF